MKLTEKDFLNFQTAFQEFLEKDIPETLIKCTQAFLKDNSVLLVEVFINASYRIIWDYEIGKQYESKGFLIPIPPLDKNEYKTNDYSFAIEYLKVDFAERLDTVKAINQ